MLEASYVRASALFGACHTHQPSLIVSDTKACHTDASDKSLDEYAHDMCAKDTSITSPRELGKRGECAAVSYLERNQYYILDRNWTCPAGEVDIVAQDDDGALVFVEVKTRTNINAGFPQEAVTKAKRQRYERIAAYYIQDYEGQPCQVRFDVVSILVLNQHRGLLRHIIDAFGVQE